MEELLRGDSAARASFLKTMTDAGIYHIDEARAYEDKAPTKGGNRSIVNGAMMPLETLGQAAPTPAAA